MYTKKMFAAWIQYVYLKVSTPLKNMVGRPKVFLEKVIKVIPPKFRFYVAEKEESGERNDSNSVCVKASELQELSVPYPVRELFVSIKDKFNPETDLLVISDRNLELAEKYDEDSWLKEVSDKTLLVKDLVNVSIVRTGYGGASLF